MTRASSLRPEPSRPVSPTTSPLCICKSNGLIFPLWLMPCASITTGTLVKSFFSSDFTAARSSKSLPIIAATSFTLGSSSIGYSPTSMPFRSTVIRSQTAYTCSRKCVTNTIATPFSFSCRIRTNSFSTSWSSREDVGSSKISTLQSISTALAIAIICWSASEYSSRFLVTSISRSRLLIILLDFAVIVFQSMVPSFVFGSLPINKFSATLKFGQRLTS